MRLSLRRRILRLALALAAVVSSLAIVGAPAASAATVPTTYEAYFRMLPKPAPVGKYGMMSTTAIASRPGSTPTGMVITSSNPNFYGKFGALRWLHIGGDNSELTYIVEAKNGNSWMNLGTYTGADLRQNIPVWSDGGWRITVLPTDDSDDKWVVHVDADVYAIKAGSDLMGMNVCSTAGTKCAQAFDNFIFR